MSTSTKSQKYSMSSQVINLSVSGRSYSIQVKDIKRFPSSYFAHMIKNEWNAALPAVVQLDRDPDEFRYIHFYLFTGHLDTPMQQINNIDTLLAVKHEAGFFNLANLILLCDDRFARLNSANMHYLIHTIVLPCVKTSSRILWFVI